MTFSKSTYKIIIAISFCLIVSSIFSPRASAIIDYNSYKYLSSKSFDFAEKSITCIIQDSLGFMWIGSRKGVLRYDGSNLEKLESINKYLEISLKTDITDLAIDKKQRLWICSRNGVSVYDLVTDVYIEIPGVTDQTVIATAVLCANNEKVYVGFSNQIISFNLITSEIQIITKQYSPRKWNGYITVNDIVQDNENNIWFATRKGIFRLEENGDKVIIENIKWSGNSNSIASNEVHTLKVNANGDLWIGTINGLNLLKKNTNHFIHFNESSQAQLVNNDVRCLTIDKSERLWVGTYDGITIIDTSFQTWSVNHNPLIPNSLNDDKIWALHTDINGNVLVGTYYGGINFWDRYNQSFEHIDLKRIAHINSNLVSCIYQDENKNIYYGTEGEGVIVQNFKDGQFKQISSLNSSNSLRTVKSLYHDGDYLWIGTYQEGLHRYSMATGKIKTYKRDINNIHSIRNNIVLSILPYKGQLALGTQTGGLQIFNPKNGNCIQFIAETSQGENPNPDPVRSIAKDAKDNLWIGTGVGLYFLDADTVLNKNGKLKAICVSDSNRLEINDIQIDKTKTIWLATNNKGLLKYKEEKLTRCGLKGVSSVFSLVQNEDYLWLSTDIGLVRYHLIDNTYLVFNEEDGLPSNEYLPRSANILSDNYIYIGGVSGVTKFHPDAILQDKNSNANVVLTSLLIYNKPIQAGDETKILKKSLPFTNKIVLKHNQNIFTLFYALPNFRNTRKKSFEYRLLNLNETWIKTNNLSATFTIQQAGNYTFEVRCIDNNGVALSPIATLDIEVLKPLWRQWWAYIIYFLVIGAAFSWMFSIIRSKTTLKHKLELESKEHMHQIEMNEQKLRFFTNISHDFRTPITLILINLQHIAKNTNIANSLSNKISSIQKNAENLLKLVNELLDFRKFESSQSSLKVGEHNIVEFVRGIYKSFKSQADDKRYRYYFKSNLNEINIWFDSEKIERVFYNLISNAFKYTQAGGLISIIITKKEESIEIKVRDNGQGIAPENISKIFDRFNKLDSDRSQNWQQDSSGIGLSIVRNIVKLHNGEIKVESTLQKGSTFTVILPFGKSHILAPEQNNLVSNSASDVGGIETNLNENDLEESVLSDKIMNWRPEKTYSILIAEDNQELAKLMQESFTPLFDVDVANNGKQALKMMKRKLPDLIISDVMMPEMNGIEFCQTIKADINTSHIPVIMLTARVSSQNKIEGLESGADEYINKPFNLNELFLRCKNILLTREKLKQKIFASGQVIELGTPQTSIDEQLMKKAFSIIQENIDNDLFDVVEFAHQMAVSRASLFNKIKAWTNKTPNELITEMRLRKALVLVKENRFRVDEIAKKVGYNDRKYFSIIFKKKFGFSPSKYSKK